MWVTTSAALVWLLVPDSVPECGAVERAKAWASDNWAPALFYQQAAVCGLRQVPSHLCIHLSSYEGTGPMANLHFLDFSGLLPTIAIDPKSQGPYSPLPARGCSARPIVGHERNFEACNNHVV